MGRIQRRRSSVVGRRSSSESTSGHSPHNSRMIRVCRALALFAGGAAAVSASALASASPAQAAVDNPQICYVDVTFDTGSDDLRSNSGVVLWLKVDGFWFDSNEMRGGASANSENRTFNNVPFYGRCVDQRRVTGYRLQLISHSDPFQGPDKWRVMRVQIKDGETSEVFTNQRDERGASTLITDTSTRPGDLYQTCVRAWDVSGHASDRLDQSFCAW